MKKTILYAVGVVAAIVIAAFVVVGCDGDFGERSETMDAFLDKFHYNKKAVSKFTIEYDGNGADSGEAPIDVKSPYDSGWTVIIMDKGSLKKAGYMFSRWNSQRDGSGKYNLKYNSPLEITENVTLFAQWDNSTTFEVEVKSSLAGTYAYGDGNYKPGDPVIITAGTPPNGWKFQNWTTTSSGVSFANADSASTSFIMPENKVTVTAMFAVISGDISSFTDNRDGKTYITVTIGEQTWMARNLDYLNDMTTGDSSWCYDDDPDNCNRYGRLYNWYAAMTACPVGWRLPDTADWNRLVNAAGGSDVAGKKLKTTSGWDGNGNGTDDYGFSALPGGICGNDGSGGSVGIGGYWWTATECGSGACIRHIYFGNDGVSAGGYGKESVYFSVRCIKND